MGWPKLIVTDSGGYQIFSLSPLKEIQDFGAKFQSHIDGSYHYLTPEKVLEIQLDLDSDVILPLDECCGFGVTKDYAKRALERTIEWAKITREKLDRAGKSEKAIRDLGFTQFRVRCHGHYCRRFRSRRNPIRKYIPVRHRYKPIQLHCFQLKHHGCSRLRFRRKKYHKYNCRL